MLIELAVDKLKAAGPFEDSAFDFLQNFEYTLGTNDLVDYGASEYVPVACVLFPGC